MTRSMGFGKQLLRAALWHFMGATARPYPWHPARLVETEDKQPKEGVIVGFDIKNPDDVTIGRFVGYFYKFGHVTDDELEEAIRAEVEKEVGSWHGASLLDSAS